MRIGTRVVWLAWLVSAACSDRTPPQQEPSVPQPQQEPSAPQPPVGLIGPDTSPPAADTTVAPLDTALGRCSVALQPPSAEQQVVIDAVRAAYGLERGLYQRGPFDTVSREQVYAHYRQGFSEQLARQLTDYAWEEASNDLRATERALTVPDSVGVLELHTDYALVAWIPPLGFRRQWGAPRCLVDRVVREDGRWIIEARLF